MARETFFVCERCKKRIAVAQNEAHRIPKDCYEVYLKAYNRERNEYGRRHVEVCNDCSGAIRKAFDDCMESISNMISTNTP